MNWLAKRIGEPSSWSGLAAIILGSIFGSESEVASPEFGACVVGVISGIVSIIKGEKGGADA